MLIWQTYTACCTVTKTARPSEKVLTVSGVITFPYKYHPVFAMIQDETFVWQQVTLEEGVFLFDYANFHGSWCIRHLPCKHTSQLIQQLLVQIGRSDLRDFILQMSLRYEILHEWSRPVIDSCPDGPSLFTDLRTALRPVLTYEGEPESIRQRKLISWVAASAFT